MWDKPKIVYKSGHYVAAAFGILGRGDTSMSALNDLLNMLRVTYWGCTVSEDERGNVRISF